MMRIAIVNDLAIARTVLREVVGSHPGLAIAWEAEDGTDAIERCRGDRPDLVLMDLVMPRCNGAEATRILMAESPCAILLVTATVDGNMPLVFEAMSYGALDAVQTPALDPEGGIAGAAELLRKIENIARLIRFDTASEHDTLLLPRTVRPRESFPPLILLGASTGGPAALRDILARFPADLPAATIIVQHVDVRFAGDFAAWLDEQSGVRVVTAHAGQGLRPGMAYLAATNDHLVLTDAFRLTYQIEPAALAYRPSVDVLFQSVAAHWPNPGVAVVLTGMGDDGAVGLGALRRAGWLTIAQDEASSVVYGMPRAAAEAGAATAILPLRAIPQAILSHFYSDRETISMEGPFDA